MGHYNLMWSFNILSIHVPPLPANQDTYKKHPHPTYSSENIEVSTHASSLALTLSPRVFFLEFVIAYNFSCLLVLAKPMDSYWFVCGVVERCGCFLRVVGG